MNNFNFIIDRISAEGDFHYLNEQIQLCAKAFCSLCEVNNYEDACKWVEDMFELLYGMYSLHENADQKNELCSNIVSYLKKNFAQDINVNDLAHHFFITPQHVNRIFKKEMGVSAKTYIIELRMRKASELLIYSNLPINAIAKRVGYLNAGSFCKFFMKWFGRSPIEYRRAFNDKDPLVLETWAKPG